MSNITLITVCSELVLFDCTVYDDAKLKQSQKFHSRSH